MWLYLYYLVYLKLKDTTEYTGLESYVSKLVAAEDIGFYPALMAMCMNKTADETESFQEDVVKGLESIESQMTALQQSHTELQNDMAALETSLAPVGSGMWG